jgi:uncharacterized membrane protein (GlpM family)
MYKGVMAYGHIVANDGLGAFIGAVNNGAILNIHFISDANAVYIAPHHGIEPDAAIVAHYYIAHDGGIGGNKAIASELWVNPFNV